MKGDYSLTDDFSLAMEIQELGKITNMFRKNVGGGKKRQQFINSANSLISSMAQEFSDRKLDMGMCEGRFWLFPIDVQIYVLGYAASTRTEADELKSVFNKLDALANKNLEGGFNAIQIIKANLEKFEQFWTRPPEYLNKW